MKTRLLAGASISLLVAMTSIGGSAAQQAQEQSTNTDAAKLEHQKAAAGAGTVDGTTTGKSGPDSKGGNKEPPLPQANLCDSYKADIKQDCLDTALRKGAPPQPRNGSQNHGAGKPEPELKNGG
jgi:hypothetical protein